MSLLMQALRKAEEAKRAAADTASTTTSTPIVQETVSLALEPLVRASPPSDEVASPNMAPSLSAEPTRAPAAEPVSAPQQKVAPPFTAPAPKAPPRTPVAEQKAAQNVFAAKAGQKNHTFIIVLAGGTLLALAGIGAYFWWQLRPSPGLTPAPVAARAPVSVVTTQAAPVATPTTPTVAANAPAIPSSTVAPPPATHGTEAASAPSLFASPAPRASGAAPIRLSSSKPKINPLAIQAYDAMQAGNLNQAQQLYQKLLATDPLQLDALYGLAAIAIQRNQAEQAEDYYLRILEIDPRDAYANAGLIGLHAKAPGENLESRLKTLIADRPSPVLHFALGNFYAKQERWREAQQAYFSAFQGDNDNPDFAFNLAISLDQLHQAKIAAQYYGVALKLARQRTAAFNPALVQERMRELQAQ